MFYIVKENDACYDLYKGTYIKNEKLDLSYSNFGKKIQINAVYIESPEILFDYVTCNHLDFVDSHFDSQSFFSMVSTELLGDYRFQSCTIISGSLMCNGIKARNIFLQDVLFKMLKSTDDVNKSNIDFSFDVWYDACENETARWQQLVKRQTLQYFTRDIYVELEKYYRHKNNDTIADDIYYHGMYGTYLILSQAGALLLPKDFVSLSIKILLWQRYIIVLTFPIKQCYFLKELMRILQKTIRCAWLTLWLKA